MTFYHSKIQQVEIEVSSYCNARCPHCLRESRNGDHTFFMQRNLSYDFFQNHFSKDIAKELKNVFFVGVMGEPAMNKDLPNIIRWFREQNPKIIIDVCTNGGIQKSEWWTDLGNAIGQNGQVIFAIDGLKDTNHIYRINVNWDKIIENVKSFISTGASAVWQFIPFKHNEHQINEAKEFSKILGFKDFKIKISHRNLTNQPKHESNIIENSEDPRYMHPSKGLDFNKMEDVSSYLDIVNITCHAINYNSIYISAEGLLYPCCHTAGLMQIADNFLPENYNWVKVANEAVSKTEISLFKNTIENIINSNTFNNIKNSWSLSMITGKNPICSIICGKYKNSVSISQLLNSKIDLNQ